MKTNFFKIGKPFSIDGRGILQDIEFDPEVIGAFHIDRVSATLENRKYLYITRWKMLTPGCGDGTKFLTVLCKKADEKNFIITTNPVTYRPSRKENRRLYRFFIRNGFIWNIRRNRLEDCPGMMYRPIGGKAREKFFYPEKSLKKVVNDMLEECQKNEKEF